MRYYAGPDGQFRTIQTAADGRGPGPAASADGFEEVDQATYEHELAAATQAAEQRAAAFLKGARQPQVDAAQALVDLGLTREQAAAVSGVSATDLEGDNTGRDH